jgi:hypothetical protein
MLAEIQVPFGARQFGVFIRICEGIEELEIGFRSDGSVFSDCTALPCTQPKSNET